MGRRLGIGVGVLMVALLWSVPAFSVEIGVGFKGGSTGFGMEVKTLYDDYWGLRLGVNGFPSMKIREVSIGGTDFDVNAAIIAPGVALDWHPFGGCFKVSAGIVYNGANAELSGQVDQAGTIDIGGTTYAGNVVGRLDADVRWNPIAPYLGLGYERHIGKTGHWKMGIDAGLLYIGKPNVNIDVSQPGNTPANQRISATDISNEEKKIEDRINSVLGEWWPSVSFGIRYIF